MYHYKPKLLFLLVLLMPLVAVLDSMGMLSLIPLLNYLDINNINVNNSKLLPHFLSTLQLFHLDTSPTINLFIILGFYIVIVLVTLSLSYIQMTLVNQFKQGFTNHISKNLFKILINSKWIQLLNVEHSVISNCLTNELFRLNLCTLFILQLATTTIILFMQLILASLIAPTLTLIIIIGGGVLFFALSYLSKQAKSAGWQFSQIFKQLIFLINEQLGLLKETKIYGLENKLLHEYNHLQQTIGKNSVNSSRLQNISNIYYKITAVLFISGIFIIAVVVLKLSIVQLISLTVLFARIWPGVNQVSNLVQNIAYTIPAYQQIRELEEKLLKHKSSQIQTIDDNLDFKHGQIKFDNITFKYPHAAHPVLDNISLNIDFGTTVLCVGQSGSGKTTLIDLLIGLLEPESGSITVNKLTLTDILPAWQNKISIVSQNFFLSDKSIHENLLWGSSGKTEAEIWNILELVDLTTKICSLPDGLESKIGNRGMHFSGGECQRLVLARALLRDPQILILDEATSALDSISEQKIYQALQRLHGKITIFIITHRLSRLCNPDKIIVLDAGKIVETGTYTQLMTHQGKFYDLANTASL